MGTTILQSNLTQGKSARKKTPCTEAQGVKKSGNHLLSHLQYYHRPSGLHDRVRDGNECFPGRIVTRMSLSANHKAASSSQNIQPKLSVPVQLISLNNDINRCIQKANCKRFIYFKLKNRNAIYHSSVKSK